jgi:hypothetical protein
MKYYVNNTMNSHRMIRFVLQYMRKRLKLYIYALTLVACFFSCKKEIQIGPPVRTITTSQVFADSADAVAAISGIYSSMINTGGSLGFGDGEITAYCGGSADELVQFGNNADFYTNSLNPLTASTNVFWQSAYPYIYQTNVCIANLQASTAISLATKNQLIGEAKFFRALFYFYLVNMYGDVPLLLTSNYQVNDIAARTPQLQVNQQIIADLIAAQGLLRPDYSISGGQRIRANQAAATALLAREYLYTRDWKDAEAQSTAIISNSTYSIVPNLNNVFLANSPEAILQWQQNTNFGTYNATAEGYNFIAYPGDPPFWFLNQPLLNAFESGDQRRVAWVDSSNFSGTTYYFAYKYKVGPFQAVANAPATEYYMVLRLAEQYLIRAEARAELGEDGAVNDLNVIRNRAGLPNYAGATDKASILTAIYHERQIELFAEWGQRWLDLRRTGQINAVMSTVTPLKSGGSAWQPNQALYPVPYSEISLDHNLTQNPGY